jgi:hypothetical protein
LDLFTGSGLVILTVCSENGEERGERSETREGMKASMRMLTFNAIQQVELIQAALSLP